MRANSSPALVDVPASEDNAMRVLRQFRQVFSVVRAHFQQVEKRAGIGGAQLWALSVIQERPGIGVNGLAQRMHIRQPTASNLVRALARRALIDVRKDGADRRAVQLHVLAAGARVLRKAPGPYAGVLPEALSGLAPTTLTRLEHDLGELISALNADAGGAEMPLGHL
jgi:DNA-binding MarR family transcriptional regulator